jgi:tRNA pseudouridine13 synthase
VTITFQQRADLAAAPYATGDMPGIGGVLKQRPEDFLVDEQPLYQPSGEGEHAWLFVEKRDVSSSYMVSVIAKHFGVSEHAVGLAGMKDKQAITRQVVSVHIPGKTVEQFPMLVHDRISILWADMHTNKLRLGHLRGNRFSIRVRGVDPLRVRDAHRLLGTLARRGAPNYFGEQRFGARRNNHLVGRALIHGDFEQALDCMLGLDKQHPALNHEASALYDAGDYPRAFQAISPHATVERMALRKLMSGVKPKHVVASLPQPQRRFWISAFQSAVFNAVLAQRVAEGTFDRFIDGDIAIKHDNGAVFSIDPAAAGHDDRAAISPDTPDDLAERLASFAISPSGPMWGPRMKRATGAAGAIELAALEAANVSPALLDVFAGSAGLDIPGARRPLRIPVIDPEVEGGVDEHGPYVRCAFELPAGSFATVVLREIMKSPDPGPSLGPMGEDEPRHSDARR